MRLGRLRFWSAWRFRLPAMITRARCARSTPGSRTMRLRYLARLRWPGGFVCSVCGGERAWRMSKGRNLRCARCRADHSVTAGTIFADTRLPLSTWFQAAWHVTGTKHGVSALGLQRLLGLGSYETAGRFCTSCDGRWCGPAVTGSPSRSKSTRPRSALPGREGLGGGRSSTGRSSRSGRGAPARRLRSHPPRPHP
jgi:hypothetical protein